MDPRQEDQMIKQKSVLLLDLGFDASVVVSPTLDVALNDSEAAQCAWAPCFASNVS